MQKVDSRQGGPLLVVFGDQLDPSIPSFLELDPTRDAIWMAVVPMPDEPP